MAEIIDGKTRAKEIRKALKEEIATLGFPVKLAVVLVGDDPASAIYVRNKTRMCKRVGIEAVDYRLDSECSESQLSELISALNKDKTVNGILVQSPLPKHLNERKMIEIIDPQKDVDGFHPYHIGRLFLGEEGFIPCTPAGVIDLLKWKDIPIEGANALVVGRSTIVGKPLADLLLKAHATLTVAHSRTKNLAEEVGRADIVVAAVGKAGLIKGEWIKEGATVIDVGTNWVDEKLIGDVEFEEAEKQAAFITPVPGGVGPMTIAMLLKNTLLAAIRQRA